MPARRKPTQPKRTVTCYDVARRAGVSQSSVSRSFRADGVIAPATRSRVLAAAAELGYHPSAFAQGLITKRSNLVAILLSNLTNLNYPEMLAALTGRLSQQGMRALLFTLDSNLVTAETLAQIWRFRVDGAIAIAHLTPDQILAFRDHDVPLILYNRVSEIDWVGSVCCDSIHGEALLVDALVAAGHRRFGVVSGLPDSHVASERLSGTLRRLQEVGHPAVAVAPGRFDYASGREALATLLAEAGSLDAVICANDMMAIGMIEEARARGLRVPEDLSVVGFDGIAPAGWDAYGLTTVRQPVDHMVSAAVAMLMERVRAPGQPAECRLFRGEFVQGRSSRTAEERARR